jgi:hypothetical protein
VTFFHVSPRLVAVLRNDTDLAHFQILKKKKKTTGLGVHRLGGVSLVRLGGILGSVGHKVKIHKITPATGKERGDLEIIDYVVLQKSQEEDGRLPPPRG